jgi:hypothetical protein
LCVPFTNPVRIGFIIIGAGNDITVVGGKPECLVIRILSFESEFISFYKYLIGYNIKNAQNEQKEKLFSQNNNYNRLSSDYVSLKSEDNI